MNTNSNKKEIQENVYSYTIMTISRTMNTMIRHLVVVLTSFMTEICHQNKKTTAVVFK